MCICWAMPARCDMMRTQTTYQESTGRIINGVLCQGGTIKQMLILWQLRNSLIIKIRELHNVFIGLKRHLIKYVKRIILHLGVLQFCFWRISVSYKAKSDYSDLKKNPEKPKKATVHSPIVFSSDISFNLI